MQISDRIKIARKALKLSQAAFGEQIGASRDAINNVENGRAETSNLIIKSICRTYNVSEVWLRSGEGEMFLPRDESAEIAEYVGSILSGEDTAFQRRLISLMSKLPPETWHLIEEKAREVFASDP